MGEVDERESQQKILLKEAIWPSAYNLVISFKFNMHMLRLTVDIEFFAGCYVVFVGVIIY